MTRYIFTKHAKNKATKLNLRYREVDELLKTARPATPEELAVIFYAKKRVMNKKLDVHTNNHLINDTAKICFVVDKNIVITMYECEYLFTANNPITNTTHDYAEHLYQLYLSGNYRVYYNKITLKECEVVKFRPESSCKDGIFLKYIKNRTNKFKYKDVRILSKDLIKVEPK